MSRTRLVHTFREMTGSYLGAALAALTMARGTLATILTAAVIMGLLAAVLAPGPLAVRTTV